MSGSPDIHGSLTPPHPFSPKSSQITSDHPQIILLAPTHPAKAATGLYLRSRNLGTILTDWGGGYSTTRAFTRKKGIRNKEKITFNRKNPNTALILTAV
jgi:hypothetical protein